MTPRSYLFVPANRPERFAKALACGADAVILDLEDAVAADAKNAARDAIARFASTASAADKGRSCVRINDARSDCFGEDLRLLSEAGIATAILPKAEGPESVAMLCAALPGIRVIALIESARGIADCDGVAHSTGVTRIAFGTLDYALDLDLEIADDNEVLDHAAARIAIASRSAGLASPIAGVTPQIDDEARLLSDFHWARRRGYGAKLCIHPRQVAPVHAALAPSAEQVEWARRVIQAEAESPGAARLDGRMIDRPVVLQAERVLRRAGH